jgi:hypothetical protein
MSDIDLHRFNPDVHYRIYLGRDGKATVICVQDFDYPDYDEARFLSPDAWDDEADADVALGHLIAYAARVLGIRNPA